MVCCSAITSLPGILADLCSILAGNQGTSFEEVGDGSSRMVTEGTGEDGTYKPSAHGGKKEDGGDDKRTR